MTSPTALTTQLLAPGLTIAAVEQVEIHGRDTFKDLVTFTRTRLTFTDGSTFTFAESHLDVYDEHPIAGETDDSGHCTDCWK